jgi:hypothetical protein
VPLSVGARTADKLELDIDAYEHRTEVPMAPKYSTFATAGLGFDLTAESWPTLTQVFASGSEKAFTQCPGRPSCPRLPMVERLPKDCLAFTPIDLLVLGDLSPARSNEWLQRIPGQGNPNHKLVLEFWDAYLVVKATGPMAKSTVTRWAKKGYQSTCRTINSLQAGGVVDRPWLVVARVHEHEWADWTWPQFPAEVTRPMNNCLRPANIPRSAYRTSPAFAQEAVDAPDCDRDAMPPIAGSFIQTPKGVRRLLNDELAKGLGMPKTWLEDHYPDGASLRTTVALHILESLTPLLVHAQGGPVAANLQDPEVPNFVREPIPNDESFEWRPPDLSPSAPWYKARVLDLIRACCLYPTPGPMIEEGLIMLRHHRSNYTATHPDPHHLQILWWMFPSEHWDDLREGSSMNFLAEPRHELTPNSEMEEEQIVIAEEFLDELVDLGVLVEVQPGAIVANGPLFCLDKPGQPGQWRILSDMRRGGQTKLLGRIPLCSRSRVSSWSNCTLGIGKQWLMPQSFSTSSVLDLMSASFWGASIHAMPIDITSMELSPWALRIHPV